MIGVRNCALVNSLRLRASAAPLARATTFRSARAPGARLATGANVMACPEGETVVVPEAETNCSCSGCTASPA